MADGAVADPGVKEPELRHAGLDHDIAEVKRLLAFSRRPSVAHHLALLVSELQQVAPPLTSRCPTWHAHDCLLVCLFLVGEASARRLFGHAWRDLVPGSGACHKVPFMQCMCHTCCMRSLVPAEQGHHGLH